MQKAGSETVVLKSTLEAVKYSINTAENSVPPMERTEIGSSPKIKQEEWRRDYKKKKAKK